MTNISDRLATDTIRLEQIKELAAFASVSGRLDLIRELPPQYLPEWNYVDADGNQMRYQAGQMVAYFGVKYLLLENVMAGKSFAPSLVSTRSMYKPYQGWGSYRWAYGEDVLVGMQREYEDVVYTPKEDIINSIVTPDLDDRWERVDFESDIA